MPTIPRYIPFVPPTLFTTRTQSGKANIRATTICTQSGKTSVKKITTQTQSGKASILGASQTKTQSGKTNIKVHTTKTQTGVSNISSSGGLTRFVAVSGLSSGTALTRGSAWNHNYAISSSNSTLQPGDTCVYIEDNGNIFISDKDHGQIYAKSGTIANPIVYRAEPGHHIIIKHDYPGDVPDIATSLCWSPVYITAQFVWIWGFDVYVTELSIKNYNNVLLAANNNKIINCTIHDAKGIGIMDESTLNTEVSGNILYYNGRQTQIGGFGYGGYIQNPPPSPTKTYRYNSVFSNWAFGQQFYGSNATNVSNVIIDYNSWWNNGNLQPDASEHFKMNVVIGLGEPGPVVSGINFRHNYGFYSASPANGHYYSMGYNGSGIDRWTVSGIVMVSQANSGFYFPEGYGTNLTFSNNMIIGPTQATVDDHPGQGNIGYVDFAAAAAARGVDVYIDKDPYESSRAYVTIYNWDGNATVSFDPSSILSSGQQYQVRSTTDFWATPVASGTWTSGNITITCANITMATALGSPIHAPVNPAPYFMRLVLLGPGSLYA